MDEEVVSELIQEDFNTKTSKKNYIKYWKPNIVHNYCKGVRDLRKKTGGTEPANSQADCCSLKITLFPIGS
jgi:hypothetical protein